MTSREEELAESRSSLAVGPANGAAVARTSGQHRVEDQIAATWPAESWRETHVLLAVSGGADSVALLRAMSAIKSRCMGSGKLFAAHLNHGARGTAADADAAWVAESCGRLGIGVEVGKADVAVAAAQRRDGWEEAARELRYEFLRGAAERVGARWVVTAHTADDQVETVLQRIIRGTGLSGLTGIPRHRLLSNDVVLMRPMLTIWKSELIDYLNELGQEYRIDSSNSDPKFARNRLRNELLPLLREKFNTDVDGAVLRLMVHADESQRFIEQLAVDLARECVSTTDAQYRMTGALAQVRIDCHRLLGQPAVLVREICRSAWRGVNWPQQGMGFAEWQLLAGMAAGEGPLTANLPGNVLVRREQSTLHLERHGLA